MSPQHLLAFVLLLSGGAGLMYEVAWTQQFAAVLGSAAESMASVFAVFLICLAAGAWLFGHAERLLKRPLLAYALMEIGIGIFGALSIHLLVTHEVALLAWLPRPDAALARVGVQVLVVFVFIGPAAILMGGTLPVVMEGASRWGLPSRTITMLYGLNTVGAACGALLPGLTLIPGLGLSGTAMVAMTINLMVGVLALVIRAWDRRMVPPVAHPAAERHLHVPSEPTNLSGAWIAGLAAYSGFSVLSVELCWARLGGVVLGNRALATSALLCGALLCLGIGSLLLRPMMRWAHTRFDLDPDRFLLGALLFGAVAQLVFGAAAAGLAMDPPRSSTLALGSYLAVMVLPFLAAGVVFPWVLAHHPEVDANTGLSVGVVYGVSVAGSTLGSLATPFAGYETIGVMGTLGFNAALTLGVALLLARRLGVGLKVPAAVVVVFGLFTLI